MTDLHKPGQHPDAEQLSTFAENALPPHERELTLAHLSTCAHCREIVSFALPAFEAPAPAPDPVPHKPWFAGWNLAWAGGFALAATLLIAVVHHRTIAHPPPNQTAVLATPPPPPSAAEPATPAINPPSAQKALPPPAKSTRARTTPQPAPRFAPPPSAVAGNASVNADEISVQSLPLNSRNIQTLQQQTPGPYTLDGIPGAAAGAGTSNGVLAEKKSSPASIHGSLSQSAPPVVSFSLAPTPASPQVARGVMAAAPPKATLPTTVNLPSHLGAASVLHRGQRSLALDTAGTLFLSTDNGAHWKAVTGPWTSHPVHLQLAGTPLSAAAPPPPTRAAKFGFPSNSTGITGTVTDPSGAAISGATVTVGYHSENFIARTDQLGQFTLPNIPAEASSLSVSSPGFSNLNQNITLDSGKISTYNLKLNIGAVSETVTVDAAASSEIVVPPDTGANQFALRRSRQPAPDAFQLTTANGETWASPDGEHWQRR